MFPEAIYYIMPQPTQLKSHLRFPRMINVVCSLPKDSFCTIQATGGRQVLIDDLHDFKVNSSFGVTASVRMSLVISFSSSNV
jgi:hypothetical protein